MKNLPNQELLETHDWEELESPGNIGGFNVVSIFKCRKCKTMLANTTMQPGLDHWLMYNPQMKGTVFCGKVGNLIDENPLWWTCEFVTMNNAIK